MRIRVLHSYRGRPSKELEIQPGEYDAADPQLFGLAEYLVANGHAEMIADDEAHPLAERDEPPAPDEADVWDKPNPPEQPIPVSKRTKKVQ